jgi:hypothetical protein
VGFAGDRVDGVFYVAPCFLDSTFDLIGCAGVGEPLVAEGFADGLLCLAFELVELSCCGVMIHGVAPVVRLRLVAL